MSSQLEWVRLKVSVVGAEHYAINFDGSDPNHEVAPLSMVIWCENKRWRGTINKPGDARRLDFSNFPHPANAAEAQRSAVKIARNSTALTDAQKAALP